MRFTIASARQSLIIALVVATVAGCAPGPQEGRNARSPAETAATDEVDKAKLRAGAEADAAYYRERAQALSTEAADEIGRTDFTRFRRGALYAIGFRDSKSVKSLQTDLSAATERDDFPAALEITGKILASDQADIRSHLLRAVALDKLQRQAEVPFHLQVAGRMFKSIVQTGDGRGIKTAWTVYRVKEEYDLVRFLGFGVESQALDGVGKRSFDILTIREAKDKPAARVYFDVTELFAEEQRSVGLR